VSERRTPDATLISALRILARDIQSGDGCANACLLEAAQRLEELVEQRRWVPVGERLPEEGVSVLWWCNSDDEDRGVFVGKRDRSLIVWGSHEWFIDADFTHWQPLPPGPEGKG
jgi:hypothetical protein